MEAVRARIDEMRRKVDGNAQRGISLNVRFHRETTCGSGNEQEQSQTNVPDSWRAPKSLLFQKFTEKLLRFPEPDLTAISLRTNDFGHIFGNRIMSGGTKGGPRTQLSPDCQNTGCLNMKLRGGKDA